MMLIQVDSEGTAKPVQENLPVPVREGKLVHAGLNVYHTDRIFIAEPVIETIPETNTMKSMVSREDSLAPNLMRTQVSTLASLTGFV